MPDELKEASDIVCKYCYLSTCWCDTCIVTEIKESNTEEEEMNNETDY